MKFGDEYDGAWSMVNPSPPRERKRVEDKEAEAVMLMKETKKGKRGELPPEMGREKPPLVGKPKGTSFTPPPPPKKIRRV